MVNIGRINRYEYKYFKTLRVISKEVLNGSSISQEELNNSVTSLLDNIQQFKKTLKEAKQELKKYGSITGFLKSSFILGTRTENIEVLEIYITTCQLLENVTISLSVMINYPENKRALELYKSGMKILDKFDIQPNWKIYLTLGGLLSRKKRTDHEEMVATDQSKILA